ncbi:ROK family protein [Alkaliphilus crotonatoxidans]
MKLIGIDLGGTEIKGGIFDWDGGLLLKKSVKTPVKEGERGVAKAIQQLINEMVNESKSSYQEVKGVGVGIPGPCDPNGLVYTAVNLYWQEVPLGEMLRDMLGLPVFIENDATVAGIAEAAKGALRGAENGVLITVGTGIGGGLIINRQAYSGSHGIGSELGHMIVGEADYDCNCGSNGCLETFASATALIKYAQKLINEGNKSSLMDRINGDLDQLSAKYIFEEAKLGDEVASRAVSRLVKYLSIGIGNLITLLDPEVVAIGGGVSKAGADLINRLNEEVDKYIFFKRKKRFAKIVVAEMENDAGIVGGAMLARERMNRE